MCGIAGMISDQIESDVFLHDIISKWESLLKHRGPDGWGWYRSSKSPVVLFHRRLAITGVNNGVQPLTSEEKDLWITFNGEMYNLKLDSFIEYSVPKPRNEYAGAKNLEIGYSLFGYL